MKEVDGYEDALQEAQEKVDHRDIAITKAKSQIKGCKQWVAKAEKGHLDA